MRQTSCCDPLQIHILQLVTLRKSLYQRGNITETKLEMLLIIAGQSRAVQIGDKEIVQSFAFTFFQP
jgi:hypothetical protein